MTVKTKEDSLIKSKLQHDLPPENLNVAQILLDSLERHSSKTLLLDVTTDLEMTGKDILAAIKTIASNMYNELKIKPNQVVMTLCDHNVNELLIAFGVILSGASIYGIKIEDGFNEWLTYCQLVKPQIIICQSRLHRQVIKLKELAQLDGLKIVWVDNPLKDMSASSNEQNNNANLEYHQELMEQDQVFSYTDQLLKNHKNSSSTNDSLFTPESLRERIDPKKFALTYILTSGSTARPKVVKLTHEHIIHMLYNLISATNHPLSDGEYILPLREGEEVFAGDLPLDHGAGVLTISMSIIKGFKLIIMPHYDVDMFWKSVSKYKITSCIASTTFTSKLLAKLKELINSNNLLKEYGELTSLRYLACCGAKLAFIDLIEEIRSNEQFKNLNVVQCYGCTEIGFLTILRTKDSQEGQLFSVGHLLPGLVAKIVDPETGELCKVNERGELHAYSKSKFEEYMCHPSDDPLEMVARCHDQEGFYRTGDQVHFDEEGRFYVHGRYKDTLTLMEDWKILPAELEEIVNKHPLVELSAVIGIPDPDLPGCDAPKAFVQLISIDSVDFKRLKETDLLRQKLIQQDREFISKDIYEFVAERTAKPKHLKGGVRILKEFPRVGLLQKVDRKALKLID